VPNEITLTLPRDHDLFGVAHLVVGGIAARFNLTLEHLEDLQIALDGLLEHGDAREATVVLRIEEQGLHARVGPFEGEALQRELDSELEPVGLRRLLDTVAAGYRVISDGQRRWIELTKEIGTLEEPA